MLRKLLVWIKLLIDDILCLLPRKRCSGSGYSHKETGYDSIRLIKDPKEVIGKGLHRTGWPWVLSNLKAISSEDGILFEDFFEQNFCYKGDGDVYEEDWATIIHHPTRIPCFGNTRERLDLALKSEAFLKSEPHLKIVFVLCEETAKWLRTRLDCKVVSLPHPASFEGVKRWENSGDKNLYQLGFYLRNTCLSDQVELPEGYNIKRVWNKQEWLDSYHSKVENYWRTQGRKKVRDADVINFLLPSKYDHILNSQIVIVEYFEVAASNVILECIAHETPIIVNRKPAIEEYLGEDYPLFYDDISEIKGLLSRVDEAHLYLSKLDKSDLHINYFLNRIKEEIYSLNN